MDSVITWEAARALRDRLHANGKRLVFTNGCFDILHVGHVRYLQEARGLGDALCVAINADASVQALKGPTRPVNPLEDRAEVLLGLRSVDMVVVFSEERATGAIEAIAPHIYAKGGDYTPETLDAEERAALDRVGAAIEILSLVAGKSTSATLAKLQRSEPKRTRLAVLGSGRGSTFEGLLAAITSGELPNTEVGLVISDQRDARILELARENGIEAVFVDPGPFATKLGMAAQREIAARLLAAGTDLVVLAGFMRRLKAPVLKAFPQRVLNVHPSLLPKYPGLRAWEQALDAGEVEAGATIHVVDEGIDSGPILGQARVPIRPEDSADSLQRRIQEAERTLYPQIIREYSAKIG